MYKVVVIDGSRATNIVVGAAFSPKGNNLSQPQTGSFVGYDENGKHKYGKKIMPRAEAQDFEYNINNSNVVEIANKAMKQSTSVIDPEYRNMLNILWGMKHPSISGHKRIQELKTKSKSLSKEGKVLTKDERNELDALISKERDMETGIRRANALGDSVFWSGFTVEGRGRLNNTNSELSYQSSKFKLGYYSAPKGKEIGHRGIGYLLTSAAANFGSSKETMSDLAQFTLDNLPKWMELLSNFKDNVDVLTDVKGDESLFLGDLLEIRRLLNHKGDKTKFKTTRPIFVDATNSGIQWLAGLVRSAAEAAFANISNAINKIDFYLETAKISATKGISNPTKYKVGNRTAQQIFNEVDGILNDFQSEIDRIDSEIESVKIERRLWYKERKGKEISKEDPALIAFNDKITTLRESLDATYKERSSFNKENKSDIAIASRVYFGKSEVISQLRNLSKNPSMTKYYKAKKQGMGKGVYKLLKSKGLSDVKLYYANWMGTELYQDSSKLLNKVEAILTDASDMIMNMMIDSEKDFEIIGRDSGFKSVKRYRVFEQGYQVKHYYKGSNPAVIKNLNKKGFIQPSFGRVTEEMDTGRMENGFLANTIHSEDKESIFYIIKRLQEEFALYIHDSVGGLAPAIDDIVDLYGEAYVKILEGDAFLEILKHNLPEAEAQVLAERFVTHKSDPDYLDVNVAKDSQYAMGFAGKPEIIIDEYKDLQLTPEEFDSLDNKSDQASVIAQSIAEPGSFDQGQKSYAAQSISDINATVFEQNVEYDSKSKTFSTNSEVGKKLLESLFGTKQFNTVPGVAVENGNVIVNPKSLEKAFRRTATHITDVIQKNINKAKKEKWNKGLLGSYISDELQQYGDFVDVYSILDDYGNNYDAAKAQIINQGNEVIKVLKTPALDETAWTQVANKFSEIWGKKDRITIDKALRRAISSYNNSNPKETITLEQAKKAFFEKTYRQKYDPLDVQTRVLFGSRNTNQLNKDKRLIVKSINKSLQLKDVIDKKKHGATKVNTEYQREVNKLKSAYPDVASLDRKELVNLYNQIEDLQVKAFAQRAYLDNEYSLKFKPLSAEFEEMITEQLEDRGATPEQLSKIVKNNIDVIEEFSKQSNVGNQSMNHLRTILERMARKGSKGTRDLKSIAELIHKFDESENVFVGMQENMNQDLINLILSSRVSKTKKSALKRLSDKKMFDKIVLDLDGDKSV